MCPSETPVRSDRPLSCPGLLEMLTADTAPKYPLVSKDTRHCSHLDSWVWLVVNRTSVLKAFLHLCWEQFTTEPPSAPAAAAAGAKSRSKPQRGRQSSSHFLEVLTSVQGKSQRGITGQPVHLHRGGDGTLASSPALSTSSVWTAVPGPFPLPLRLH